MNLRRSLYIHFPFNTFCEVVDLGAHTRKTFTIIPDGEISIEINRRGVIIFAKPTEALVKAKNAWTLHRSFH
jgi:hypothetical protein